MRRLMMGVVALVVVFGVSLARAQINPTAFQTPVPVNIDLSSSGALSYPDYWCVSPDGQTLAFKNMYGPQQVWTEQWSQNGPGGSPGWTGSNNVSTQLGQTWTNGPSITSDNQWLYYDGGGTADPGVGRHFYRAPWLGTQWGAGQPITAVETVYWKNDPFFDTATSRLYFCGGTGNNDDTYDLYYSSYSNGVFASPVMVPVSSSSGDYAPRTADNGTILFWSSDRPGGYGGYDIWEASFNPATNTYGTAVNCGPTINNSGDQSYPSFNAARNSLYFENSAYSYTDPRRFEESVVPEPSTLALLGVGAIALVGYGWRRRRPSA